MATFIKGLTDQLGPMQLYKPDYQFLTQVYGTRQAEYDRGFSMVKNLYNSVLNSALTNSGNETFRQEAFKKLQGALKNVSNVDLSNPTNIMRAQSLIDPISQDQDMAYDMAVTKYHQSQKQKMEQYRNSTDPKMRGMYNEYSKMDIAFAEDDLRNAKRGDGSVQKIQPREFVPFEDTMEYLRKEAKAAGLEITQSGPDGRGYIMKKTNGPGVAPIFEQWAKATMGNKFDRQFQVMGRVSAESAIRNEMSTTGISRDEAVQKISQKMFPVINAKVSTEGVTADKELKKLDDEIDLYEKKYPNGFPPTLANVKDDYMELLKKRDTYKENLDGAKSEVAKMQQEGPQYVASNLYSLFSSEAKDNTAKVFGGTFATAKQAMEYKPDTTWATKFRVASQEKIAGARLSMDREKLNWDKEKTAMSNDLKILALKGKGYIPSEESLGSGIGEKQYGADLISEAMSKNKEKLYLNTFNGENGLALLVLNEDANKYSEFKAAVSKMKAKGNLSAQEWNVVKSYGKQVGVELQNYDKNQASLTLDMLAGATYNAATAKLGQYSKMHKTSDAQKFVKSFVSASDNFKVLESERKNLNQNMLRLSQEVVDENGNVKEMYRGAKIRGMLATGGYDIDFSGVTEAAKTRLQGLVTSEYSSRLTPVGQRYNFSKLGAAEVEVLVKDPYSVSAIKASDGTSIDMGLLKNLNASDLSELFGDQANVFYDGKNAQVQLNLSQKTEISKKLGIKGAGTLTFTLPYESIQSNPALKRFNAYTQRNTVTSQSLGVLDDFMTNPNARVSGNEYHNQFGFDYNIVGTQDAKGNPNLLFNVQIYNPHTQKTETKSEMVPYTLNDVESLIKANTYIESIFDRYIISRVSHENK